MSTGSGGVGKTTTAAAIGGDGGDAPRGQGAGADRRPGPAAGQRARAGAVRQRRDPGAGRRRSPPPAWSREGELWAAMLDTKQSWDDLIAPARARRATHDAILANPLYQNITGKFVQSHDYVAMERLYEIHTSGRYDLIVVDTPPTRNAVDFLEAPERMADFFSSRLLRWLITPYRSRLRRTWPPSPSTRWRTGSSAASSWRTSPSSSCSSRRCTTGSWSGPRR